MVPPHPLLGGGVVVTGRSAGGRRLVLSVTFRSDVPQAPLTAAKRGRRRLKPGFPYETSRDPRVRHANTCSHLIRMGHPPPLRPVVSRETCTPEPSSGRAPLSRLRRRLFSGSARRRLRAWPVLVRDCHVLFLVAAGDHVPGALHHPTLPPQAGHPLDVVLDPDEGLVDGRGVTRELMDRALEDCETAVDLPFRASRSLFLPPPLGVLGELE